MIVPYMLPILLGQTFHYQQQTQGVDIFNRASLKKHTVVIPNYSVDSSFKMVRSGTDASKFLEVKGELSLKVMGGAVSASARGGYLKDRKNRRNSLEVLVRTTYKTVTETLRDEVVPEPLWSTRPKEFLGTHYVRSVTYGGELIASLVFTAKTDKSLKKIEAAISASVGVSGKFAVAVGASFKSLKEKLEGESTLEVKYYATVPMHGIASDMETFMTLLREFPKEVYKIDGGRGNPLNMEIVPLSVLKSGIHLTSFIREAAIASQLDEVTDKYTDILSAYSTIREWSSNLDYNPPILQAVSVYYRNLLDIKRKFERMIFSLDVSSLGNPNQFDEVNKAYRGPEKLDFPGKYMDDLRLLQEKVDRLKRGITGDELCNVTDVENPCLSGRYSMKESRDRTVNLKFDRNSIVDDSSLPTHWYRFDQARIVESCPDFGKCGTLNPVWLDDGHPPEDGRIYRRQMCVQNGVDCRSNCFEIRVKSCAGFSVYYLPSTPRRSAYCVKLGA